MATENPVVVLLDGRTVPLAEASLRVDLRNGMVYASNGELASTKDMACIAVIGWQFMAAVLAAHVTGARMESPISPNGESRAPDASASDPDMG